MKIVRLFNLLTLLLYVAIIFPQTEKPVIYSNFSEENLTDRMNFNSSRSGFDRLYGERYTNQPDLKVNNDITVIDSVITATISNKTDKCIYTYDENGNNIQKLFESSYWGKNLSFSYTYDQYGNMISELFENYDGIQWVTYRYSYNYDFNGNKTLKQTEYWVEDHWLKDDRFTYSFDLNGNITVELCEEWDGNQWINYSRFSYSYDLMGNKTLVLYERWVNNQWLNNSRDSYTYDITGKIISIIFERWESNNWVNANRYSYSYDSNGNRTSTLFEIAEVNFWTYSKRETYTFDTNNHLTSYLKESWYSGKWQDDFRQSFTYDNYGNLTSLLEEDWIFDKWSKDFRWTYTYDTNGNLIYEKNEKWDTDKWTKGFATLKIDGIYYDNVCEANIYYSTITVDVAENSEALNDFSLSQNYPNPFNPTTMISYQLPMNSFVNLRVYDILGREVATLVNEQKPAGNYEVKFDASNLSSGVYLYKLQAGSYNKTMKMILMK